MNGTSKRILLADSSLIVVSLFWGLGFVAMKDGLYSFPVFWLTAVRFGSAFAIMLALFRKRVTRITRSELKGGIIIGIFLFLAFVAQTMALDYTTVGKVAFLTTVYVMLIPFLSWMVYKKSPGVTAFLASILSLAGMGLLTLDSGLSAGPGESLTLICAVFFAIHMMLIEYFVKDADPLLIATIQVGVVAILSFSAALVFESWPSHISGSSMMSVGFSSLFCTVLAFMIQTSAQKFTPSTHTAIILSLESVFGAIFGIILLGDPVTFRIISGFFLILVAVLRTELMPYLGNSYRRKSSDNAPAAMEHH